MLLGGAGSLAKAVPGLAGARLHLLSVCGGRRYRQQGDYVSLATEVLGRLAPRTSCAPSGLEPASPVPPSPVSF